MRERIANSHEPAQKGAYAELVKKAAVCTANTAKVSIAETFAEGMCRLHVISLITPRMCATPAKTESCA